MNFKDKEEVQMWVDQVKRHCPTAIKWYLKGIELYRGMGNEVPSLGWKRIRSDRKPLSSSKFEDKLFNKIAELKGLPTRKESLFVTRSSLQAIEYGRVFLCFPADPFSYYYYPDIQDMTLAFPDALTQWNNFLPIMKAVDKAKSIEEIKDAFKSVARNDPRYKDLIDRSVGKASLDHLWGMYDGKVDDFIDSYDKVNKNKGIERNKDQEIMIQNKKGYWFVLEGAFRPNELKMLLTSK